MLFYKNSVSLLLNPNIYIIFAFLYVHKELNMYITKKAEHNLKAASLLIENELYAPSIHCSYYAGFQMSKRKLAECGITYDEQDQAARDLSTDSHNYIITTTEEYVSDPIKYRHNIGKLKRLRKKSDYLNQEIVKAEAEAAKTSAWDLFSILFE